MRYSSTRDTIKTGDLLAWKSGSWKSWHDIQALGVRVGTASSFSHVGMAWADNGRVFVIEATTKGVRLFPLSRLVPFYLVRRPTELEVTALEWAFAHIGDEYESKLKMVWMALLGRDMPEDDRYQCAELYMTIMKKDGEFITCAQNPSALVEWAMKNWNPLILVD